MRRNRKQRALIGVAAAAVAAGVVVAIATAGHSHAHHRHARVSSAGAGLGGHGSSGDLAVAASYLGLTTAQLNRDLRAGRTLAGVAATTAGKSATGLLDALVNAKAARLGAAVADGKPPKPGTRESARLARLRRRTMAEIDRPRGAGGDLTLAASYLGLTRDQVLGERRSGRSLAQLADATRGKSAAGLIEALVSARKANLVAAVAAGSLSPARESTQLSTLAERVTAEVDRSG